MKSTNTSSSTAQNSDLSSQLKSLQAQVAAMSRKLKQPKRTPVPEKVMFAHERESGLKEKYADYRDNLLADYVYGLYHPDIVFKECLDIKSPSYMPVPTTTFKFKETFTIAPNAFGNFVLWWSPNFLGTESSLARVHGPNGDDHNYTCYFSNIYSNRSSRLDGNAALLNEWYGICFKHVQQDFEKYRLTSACIKVKYTGKVLDQAGMLAASATYVRGTRTVLGVPVTEEAVSSYELPLDVTRNLAQFCDFDNIRQGQWADTCSVVSDPDGITCVYVPTDPLNQVFVGNATTIDAINHRHEWNGSRYIAAWEPTNANISYAICGYGLTPGSSCITVEVYYNFEIIVRQEQYPYFSPRVAHPAFLEHKDDITRITDAVTAKGLISHTKTHDNGSVWNKVKGAFSKAAKVATDVYPYIKPLINMLV